METVSKPRLSVNINKLATLRNSRGGNNPDILAYAKKIESYGAEGITVHPRPDQRHIRYADVYALRRIVTTELNIEGYPSPEFIKMVLEVVPEQVTLVPDPPEALTSSNGWDTRIHRDFLKDIVSVFKQAGIRNSLFINPDPEMMESAASTGTDRIELYTESYAANYALGRENALLPYIASAKAALHAGVGINAGHDLDLSNLHYFSKNLPGLLEVSIGHALICDAIEFGMSNTVKMYLGQL